MTWKQTTVIRILLLVARMLSEQPWQGEIGHLSNHITTSREPVTEDLDRRISTAILAARPGLIAEAIANVSEIQRRAE